MDTVLVVDDDPHILDVIVFALEKQSFKTLSANNGVAAVAMVEKYKPDLIIMDVMMPEMSGLDACKLIRQKHDIPIIFVSAMNDEVDMIVGLELGGDDYICKPFSPRQLIARVRAVFRRIKQTNVDTLSKDKQFSLGLLNIDKCKYKVYWDEQEVVLTVTEFNLLNTLASYPGKVFSRDELLELAYDNVIVSDRTIDSHIRRVRAKFASINAYPIETVHGAGYKLSECE